MSDIQEVKFRVMTTARVFHNVKTGMITQMFIDDSRLGILPGDFTNKKTERFLAVNTEALGLAVAMCLLHIANAKTEAEKEAAAKMSFGSEEAPAGTPAEVAKRIVDDVMKQAAEPVIPDVMEKKGS